MPSSTAPGVLSKRTSSMADHAKQIGDAARAKDIHPGIGAHEQACPEGNDRQRDEHEPVFRIGFDRQIIGDGIGNDQAEKGTDRRDHQGVPERGRAGGKIDELGKGECRPIAALRRPLAKGEDHHGHERQDEKDKQPSGRPALPARRSSAVVFFPGLGPWRFFDFRDVSLVSVI